MKRLKAFAFIGYFLICVLITTCLPLTASAFTNVTNNFDTSADNSTPLDKSVSGIPTALNGTSSKINIVVNALGKVGGDKSVLLRALPTSNSAVIAPDYLLGEINKNILAGSDGVYRAAFKASLFIPELEQNSANVRFTPEVTISDQTGTLSYGPITGNEAQFQKTDGSQNLIRSVGNLSTSLGNSSAWDTIAVSKNFDKGGQWYSIAFVTENDKLMFYMDGQLMRTLPMTVGMPDQHYIKTVQIKVGFSGTVSADKVAWIVFDDFQMINSTDGINQDSVYTPLDSDTRFTIAQGGTVTLKYPNHFYDSNQTQADTYAEINGVAQNMTVGNLLAQMIPAPGGEIYAVKFKKAIRSNLSANFLSTAVNAVSNEFETTLLANTAIVDLDTKIVSKSRDGSIKIYSIPKLSEVAGGKDTVKNVGIYSLNTTTGRVENVPNYTSAAYFLNQITTNVPGAKKEIKVSGNPYSFAGIMRSDKSYSLRITAVDNSSYKDYPISFNAYPISEGTNITIPDAAENILTSFDITKNIGPAVLEYKNTIGDNVNKTIAKIENSTLYVGATPLSHINKNTLYKIKIETEVPVSSSSTELNIKSVWVNGTKLGENIPISLQSSVGTGIKNISFDYNTDEFSVTKLINGIGKDGYQAEYDDTNLISDFFGVEFYKYGNYKPTIKIMPEANMTVYDMLVTPNVFGVRFAPGKIDVHHESVIKIFDKNGALLAEDEEVDEDPDRPNTPGNDRTPEMLLPLESGMTLEIASKNGSNKVTYLIKVGEDDETSPFYDNERQLFSLSELEGNTITYKKAADSDEGTVILVAYNKAGQLQNMIFISDDTEPELVDNKYIFKIDLDISGLEIENTVFKCMHWDGYGNLKPLDAKVDVLD